MHDPTVSVGSHGFWRSAPVPREERLPGVSDDHIHEAFSQLDSDGNGYVGAAEIRLALTLLGEEPLDEEIDEMIRMLDEDGLGQVTFEGFANLFADDSVVLEEMSLQKPADEGTLTRAKDVDQARAEVGMRGFLHIKEKGEKQQVKKNRSLKRVQPNVSSIGSFIPGSIQGGGDEFALAFGDMTLARLKQIKKTFQKVDTDGSGFLDFAEFCQAIELEEDDPTAGRLFELFDKDESGAIEISEFVAGLSMLVHSNHAERVRFVFDIFDSNNDGWLQFEEICRLLKSHFSVTQASTSEIRKRASHLLSIAGKEPDGQLSADEFADIALQMPSLLYPAFALMARFGGSSHLQGEGPRRSVRAVNVNQRRGSDPGSPQGTRAIGIDWS